MNNRKTTRTFDTTEPGIEYYVRGEDINRVTSFMCDKLGIKLGNIAVADKVNYKTLSIIYKPLIREYNIVMAKVVPHKATVLYDLIAYGSMYSKLLNRNDIFELFGVDTRINVMTEITKAPHRKSHPFYINYRKEVISKLLSCPEFKVIYEYESNRMVTKKTVLKKLKEHVNGYQ